MYVARDKDGDLYLFENKPVKRDDFWTSPNGIIESLIKCDWFPEVKWEDEEPKELILK